MSSALMQCQGSVNQGSQSLLKRNNTRTRHSKLLLLAAALLQTGGTENSCQNLL